MYLFIYIFVKLPELKQSLYHIAIPLAKYEHAGFTTFYPTFSVVSVCNSSHPDRSMLVSHHGFNLHFPGH